MMPLASKTNTARTLKEFKVDVTKELRELNAEIKRTFKYVDRSAKAMRRNTKKLKMLERRREMLLTPMLPGIFE